MSNIPSGENAKTGVRTERGGRHPNAALLLLLLLFGLLFGVLVGCSCRGSGGGDVALLLVHLVTITSTLATVSFHLVVVSWLWSEFVVVVVVGKRSGGGFQ